MHTMSGSVRRGHQPDILEKYFYPLVRANEIYRCIDEHGYIIVYEFKQFRVMTFDSLSEQSKARLGDPLYLDHEYTRAMLLPLLNSRPDHVTLLGLGAGVLASCLHCLFPDVKLVAVEWRQAVIDVAYQYFDLPKDGRLDVRRQDALSWLQESSDKSTDLLLSDLYHANTMSETQLEKDFYENCFRVIRDEGWLVLNFHSMPATDSFAIEFLRIYFPSVFILQANTGNWVVIAGKTVMTPSFIMEERFSNELPAAFRQNLRLLRGRLVKMHCKY